MRLGTYYRSLMLEKMNIKANGTNILDVGCYDGYFLSRGRAKTKVGVDLKPVRKYANVKYIQGDICQLNFKNKKFDKIFAFDVLEHVKDDRLFLKSLIKLLNKNGKIILSTPHKEARIFPPFLTNYANKRWGHYRVSGYLASEVKELLPQNINTQFIDKREVFYRTFYLSLWLMWHLSETLTKPLVRLIAWLDNLTPNAKGGHLFIILTRK